MSRPPKIPKEERIKRARIFVARYILENGAPPAVRKLNYALGYSSGGAARTYDAVRALAEDPGVMYVETDWQNFLFPIEVFEGMMEGAKKALKAEGVDVDEKG